MYYCKLLSKIVAMKLANNNNQVQKIFEILVRENADMLMTYLHSAVKNGTVAEDLFQETMLTAWKKLSDYDHSRPQRDA